MSLFTCSLSLMSQRNLSKKEGPEQYAAPTHVGGHLEQFPLLYFANGMSPNHRTS